MYALNCWNLPCVFKLKCVLGARESGVTLSLGALFAEQLEVVHDLCKLWWRAIKNDGRVFNQARGSPHLIPGSRLAKWLLSHSATSLRALCFSHAMAVSAGSRRLSCPDQMLAFRCRFALCMRIWVPRLRGCYSAVEGVTKPSRGSKCVPRKGFWGDGSGVGWLDGVNMQFLCNTRHTFGCVFCQMTWPGILRSHAHAIQPNSDPSGSSFLHSHDKEIIY